MSMVVAILIAVVLAYLLSLVPWLRNYWRLKRAAHGLPGPDLHPVFDNLATFAGKSTAELFVVMRELAKRHRDRGDSIMRFVIKGSLFVWPLNGKAVAAIIDSTTEINKGKDYDFFKPWLGGGLLLEGAGERWRSHRKMLTPAFHFAKLAAYFEVFNAESRVLVECLDRHADDDEPVDVFAFIKRCALDVICGTAMGTKVDAQIEHEHKYVRAVETFNRIAVVRSFNPFLQLEPIFWALGYRKQTNESLNELKNFTNTVIKKRKAAFDAGDVDIKTTKRKMNFLDLLLSMKEANVLTDEDIRQEVDTFMFAGHDTTTSSLSWACWQLAHHQTIQQKVYEELLDVFGDDLNEPVTLEGVNRLQYTDRVLKESKRMIPPVPAIQRKLVDSIVMDGYEIPAGANITIAPLVIHDNHLVYPNPTRFDPDRFRPDAIAQRHPYDFIPFSAGPRNCIGQKFAQLNEKVMLTYIVRHFKLEPAAEFDATKPCVEVVTKPSDGIPVRLTRRN
ncbi:unnamed protein product [Caenorhabditis bovis]|uniref:Cytochrome P450 n=1 Tax=Caenorhabditis bovis TaxID=2654633 RepID=A0A8S1EF55_9PELO|nr:unnamed protein product [Caenorhabditis bovis]